MNNKLMKSALWYARHGWYVIPLHNPLFDEHGDCVGCSCEQWKREKHDPDFVCGHQGKHPRISKWEQKATRDEAQIRQWWGWWPRANIAIAAGKSGLVVVDIDTYKSGATEKDYETVTAVTGGGGRHFVFSHPEIDRQLGNGKAELPEWIDIKAHGGSFTVPPSVHKSGNAYHWQAGRGVHEMTPAVLPDEFAQPLYQAILDKELAIANRQQFDPTNVDEKDVVDALACIPPTGDYHEHWLKIIMAVHSAFPTERGIAMVESWSPGRPGEVAEKWRSFTAGSGVGIGTLFHIAKQYGWRKWRPVAIYDEV